MSYLSKWIAPGKKHENSIESGFLCNSDTLLTELDVNLEPVTSEGEILIPSIAKPDFNLHTAVMRHDEVAVDALIAHGADMNQRDELNATALHVAVVLGNVDMARQLISLGADPSLICHDDCSVVDLALVKGNVPMLGMLLDKLTQEQCLALNTEETLTYAMHDFFGQVEKAMDAHQYDSLALKAEQLVLLCRYCHHPLIMLSEDYKGDMTDASIVSILRSISALVDDEETANILEQTADRIIPFDGTFAHFIAAKNLLHIMSMSGVYDLAVDTTNGEVAHIEIDAEGHSPYFTMSLVQSQINQFISSISYDFGLKRGGFEFVSDMYAHAHEYASRQALMSTAETAYERYLQGECVLLPSGWDGHFICVILNPKTNQFIMANSGQRFSEYDAGNYIFDIAHPEHIDADLIYQIMNNEDQLELEFALNYELGLMPSDFLPGTAQVAGNCAWQANECAIEALLYLHFNEQCHDSDAAKVLAHQYYLEWDTSQTLTALHEYFDGDPRLGFEAVLDMLTQCHPSLFDDGLPIDNDELESAEYLISVISECYQEDYAQLHNSLLDGKPEVAELIQQYEPLAILSSSADSIITLESVLSNETDLFGDTTEPQFVEVSVQETHCITSSTSLDPFEPLPHIEVLV